MLQAEMARTKKLGHDPQLFRHGAEGRERHRDGQTGTRSDGVGIEHEKWSRSGEK